MSNKRVKSAYGKLIDLTVFLYFVFTVVCIVYGVVTAGVTGLINALIIVFATAIVAFCVLVVIGMFLAAVCGKDVYR